MIINRYIIRELLVYWVALSAILVLIFLSNQLIRYLSVAAAGNMPVFFIIKLITLEIPNLLSLLMPLGLYLSILLVYGRMYAESEMVVLEASGLTPLQRIRPALMVALLVALIVGYFSLFLGPNIRAEREQTKEMARSALLVDLIMPGQFHVAKSGNQVVYVESLSSDRELANGIFVANRVWRANRYQWQLLRAKSGRIQVHPLTKRREVILEDGVRYEGVPGDHAYQVLSFGEYRITEPEAKRKFDTKVVSADLPTLYDNQDNPEYVAELQWRLSIPISVLALALVAVGLSKLRPRQGKYAKLLPAALIYITYANLMFVCRDWLETDKISPMLGMWWLHLSLMLLAAYFLLVPNGIRSLLGRRI